MIDIETVEEGRKVVANRLRADASARWVGSDANANAWLQLHETELLDAAEENIKLRAAARVLITRCRDYDRKYYRLAMEDEMSVLEALL